MRRRLAALPVWLPGAVLALVALVGTALLLTGCGNSGWALRSGQIQAIERGDHCYVTVQDPDPLVAAGPSRFEVTCASVANLNPGDDWPPK